MESEKGFLGYPTSSDIPQGDFWYRQNFQGGHVYTHNMIPFSQASIQGRIFEKWQSLGAQNSELGYPISDELPASEGGRYSVFERGMIYWTPALGAHAVTGGILVKWAASGFESGSYGYPTGDAVHLENGLIQQDFQYGKVTINPSDFLGEYSCLSSVDRLVETFSIEGDYQFICGPKEVTVSDLFGNVFHGTPLENFDRSERGVQLVKPFESSGEPQGIECDTMVPTSITEPRRISDFSVSKNVHTCIGAYKQNYAGIKAIWTREISWTIKSNLQYRRFANISISLDSLTTPPVGLTIQSRVREDRRHYFDYDVVDIDDATAIIEPGDWEARVSYENLVQQGIYFVEPMYATVRIPKWKYGPTRARIQFVIGRYGCPPFEESDPRPCRFPAEIDDHSTP